MDDTATVPYLSSYSPLLGPPTTPAPRPTDDGLGDASDSFVLSSPQPIVVDDGISEDDCEDDEAAPPSLSSSSSSPELGACSLSQVVSMALSEPEAASALCLTLSRFSDAGTVLETLLALYREQLGAGDEEQRRRFRRGAAALVRSWSRQDPWSLCRCERLHGAVTEVFGGEECEAEYHPTLWTVARAIAGQSARREDLFELARVMISEDGEGLLSPESQQSHHFSGGQLFSWLESRCCMSRRQAEELACRMEAHGIIQGVFKQEAALKESSTLRFTDFSLLPCRISDDGEVPEPLPLLRLSPTEVAHQICLREALLFGAIRLEELSNNAWQKPATKAQTSPNVLAMIHFSNKISAWIATEIVSTTNIKKRVEVLKRAILVADVCLQNHCYSAVAEILAGLQYGAVRKLTATWMALPFKYRDVLHHMMLLMSPNHNFRTYRKEMASLALHLSSQQGGCAEFPVVPHLGQYLTDLTFADAASPDTVGPCNLVNFKKMRLVGGILRELRLFQWSVETAAVRPARYREDFQRILLESTLCAASDDELAVMARLLEPPEVAPPSLPAGTQNDEDAPFTLCRTKT